MALTSEWSKAVEDMEAAVADMRKHVSDTDESFSEAQRRATLALESAEDARTKLFQHGTKHGC